MLSARSTTPLALTFLFATAPLPAFATSGDQSAPTTRAYSAFAAAGIGAFAGSQGRLTVKLELTPSGTGAGPGGVSVTRYHAKLLFRALSCPPPAPHIRCLRISGTLSGQAVDDPRVPNAADLPARIKLTTLKGTLKSLGATTAQGEITGTGFIRNGRRRLALKLSASQGKLVVGGSGPPVPGFTAP